MSKENKEKEASVVGVEKTAMVESSVGAVPKKHWYSLWWGKVIIVVSAAIVVGCGIGSGYYFGFTKGYSQTKNVNITGIANGATPSSVTADFTEFWNVWDLLKSSQVDSGKVSDQQLMYGAISGLAGAYNDPYTVFFDPSDADEFLGTVQGSFGGIGAELGSKDGQIMIIAPLKGTPAYAAGLQAGDQILNIDSTSTANMSIDQAVQLIRGTPGTKVDLTIARDSWASPKVITITRAIVNVPTVDSSMKNGNILYVQLYEFDQNANQLFGNAVISGLEQGARGMILDLRNDPGGYLDQAVAVAGWFLKPGTVVVKERYANGSEDVLTANGNAALSNFPVVILINGGSASASEILSGALRVDRGVKLIGDKSFGKGSVQQLTQLPDGSAVKITIAKWLLPDGSAIDKVGLVPDYSIPITATDTAAGVDPQLNKAIEVIDSEIAK
ncbi:MAG: S41 family peptidase [Patescibacteria group bacterium]|nr:S41 family peptidase [Patescibacteria group bacterium]MCL5224284.1 S41 family peptidase [Patescibacteria group bacterium]